MKYLIGMSSFLVIFLLSLLVSKNRKLIRYRYLLIMVGIQFLCAYILLNTSVGNNLIKSIARNFERLLQYAGQGVNFVFGGLLNPSEFSFFLSVLMPIVFISALIGILQFISLPRGLINYIKRKRHIPEQTPTLLDHSLLTSIINAIGLCLSKINGMGRLESYNAVASAILGQSEVFISLKKQLPSISEQRLYTLCTSAMSTISMSIIGAYMNLLEPSYVVTAIVLNLFGGFIIASIINPYRVQPEEDVLEIATAKKQSFFEMLSEYILDGFKVAIIVGAMLIGFTAIITMINAIFSYSFGITFDNFLGYIFSPFALLTGVPMSEAISVGSLMGKKLVSNEFVAMADLADGLKHGTYLFSERTKAIISVFLVSFANFSSIGIICGAVSALDVKQGRLASRFGLKLVYGATLVSFLSATIVGLIL